MLNTFWVIIFYVNANVLLPRLVYKRKILSSALVSFFASFGVAVLFDNMFFHAKYSARFQALQFYSS